jgi:ribose 5-phosphate isomerase A
MGDVRLVVNEELGQHAIDVVVGAGPAQRLFDHDAGAVTDAGADGLGRDRRMTAPLQHVVKRVGEVRRGVDQGAVEIEHDGGALDHGRMSHTAACGLASGGVESVIMAGSATEPRGEGRLGRIDDLKDSAARAALDLVNDGMRLGLGTGSTASRFVAALGERVAAGLNVICVPTSEATRAQAERLNIPLTTLDQTPQLDLTVDGADEIDGQLRMIKGGGGALLREKIVATASDRMVVVADDSKLVPTLGLFPLPVEVVRFGLMATMRLIEAISAETGCHGAITLRPGPGDAPFVTDQGNLILDCAFGSIPEPEVLAFSLKRVPGVVEHGLFLGLADLAIVAGRDGVKAIRRAGA